MTRLFSKDTVCVHAGAIASEAKCGVRSPLFPATACRYLTANEDYYPRHGNLPNQRSLAAKLCELEQGEDAVVVGSGMSAISFALTGILTRGDHLLLQEQLYSGAIRYITNYLHRVGIQYTIAEGSNRRAFELATQPNTRAFYLESPTNPMLSIVDISDLASLARERGILTVFDNTVATPINQNPLILGVDLVVHSATKFLGGHGDLSGGAIIGSRQLIGRIRELIHDVGGYLDPANCHLLERSLQTLSVRIDKSNSSAQKLADFLRNHPNVTRVYYPGLSSHPLHALACKQMSGFGALISFELEKAVDPRQFQQNLKLIVPANSFGEVTTTLNCPAMASSSYANLSHDQKLKSGITPQLVKLSVGIESFQDLKGDLAAALGREHQTASGGCP